MSSRRSIPGSAVDCATLSGHDCAQVFAAAADWLADPAQSGIQLWGIELDQPRRSGPESDADVYLDLFFRRSDSPARRGQEYDE